MNITFCRRSSAQDFLRDADLPLPIRPLADDQHGRWRPAKLCGSAGRRDQSANGAIRDGQSILLRLRVTARLGSRARYRSWLIARRVLERNCDPLRQIHTFEQPLDVQNQFRFRSFVSDI
jgi:hypothetical protein